MAKKTVYLAGPINGCDDATAMDWRNALKAKFGYKFDFLDPMARDYRGRELEPGIAAEIVNGDKEDIENSQIIIAYVPNPSVGTSMELMYAWLMRKEIVVICTMQKPSPWLIHHCNKMFTYFQPIFDYLEQC